MLTIVQVALELLETLFNQARESSPSDFNTIQGFEDVHVSDVPILQA
jgi:hypothetical protein